MGEKRKVKKGKAWGTNGLFMRIFCIYFDCPILFFAFLSFFFFVGFSPGTKTKKKNNKSNTHANRTSNINAKRCTWTSPFLFLFYCSLFLLFFLVYRCLFFFVLLICFLVFLFFPRIFHFFLTKLLIPGTSGSLVNARNDS